MSVVEGYIDALQKRDYDKAISFITPQFIASDAIDKIVRWAIRADPSDNPDFIRRLMRLGVHISTPFTALSEGLHKPKTVYVLLREFGVCAHCVFLLEALQYNERIVAVITAESAHNVVLDSSYADVERLYFALSHAKRATYALLKSHKLFGKDVMRIIAKLVWGSRANINWEK